MEPQYTVDQVEHIGETIDGDAYGKAVDAVDSLIQRNLELEQILGTLQPLLLELSIKIYKDDDKTISLDQLVADGIEYVKNK